MSKNLNLSMIYIKLRKTRIKLRFLHSKQLCQKKGNKLPSLEPENKLSEKTLPKTISFAEILNEEEKLSGLPSKIISLEQKLEIPDYDTTKRLKKIQETLTKEYQGKKLYDDVEEFKDLREEKENRNRISSEKAKILRTNFVQTAVVHKPDIVSEFMKAFSVETQNLNDLIQLENKEKDEIYDNKPKTNSKKIKAFTDTLISQSSLMQKLLNK